MMLSPPSSLTSPTTAQIFDVPTSRPTMTDDWSNMFLPVPWGFVGFRRGGRRGAGLEPNRRRVVCHRQIERPQGSADFPAVIMREPPVAQLLLQAVERKSDPTSLHRRDLQHLRPGYIHARQVHQPRH